MNNVNKTMMPGRRAESGDMATDQYQREVADAIFAMKAALALKLANGPYPKDLAEREAALRIFEAACAPTSTSPRGIDLGDRTASHPSPSEYVGRALIDEIEARLGARSGADIVVRSLRIAAREALGVELPDQALSR